MVIIKIVNESWYHLHIEDKSKFKLVTESTIILRSLSSSKTYIYGHYSRPLLPGHQNKEKKQAEINNLVKVQVCFNSPSMPPKGIFRTRRGVGYVSKGVIVVGGRLMQTVLTI